MSQENVCLLCNTENAKYDKDFLAQRAYFSAPKLQELRLKWNEAIIKIHPVLEDFVKNVNTYKVCDLHFRESDIKKSISDKSSHQNACTLPLWNWVLKLKALPLSGKELEKDKSQILKADKSKENLNYQFENFFVNQDHTYVEKMRFNFGNNNNNNDETNKSLLAKESEVKEKNLKEGKQNFQPMKHDREKVKFAPYPSVNANKKEGSNNQMVKLPSVKNKVLVVSSGSKVVPISPPSVTPSFKYPIISSVTSLASNVQKNPKYISIHKLASLQQNCPTKVIPISKKPALNNSSSTAPVVFKSSISVRKSSVAIPVTSTNLPITFANSISEIIKEPTITTREILSKNEVLMKANIKKFTETMSSNIELQEKNVYNRLKLIDDLEKRPLPSGWAYKYQNEGFLFTQYCTIRRFPIFLSLDEDLTSAISLGHEAVTFIPKKIPLKSFADLCKGLRQLEGFKWCLGIGFDQNNHSDLCLILCKTLNSRCYMCAKIRHNAQRRENLEIKQRKQPKDLRPLMNNLKRTNGRLEAKVCKLKLMVNHLKKKQCAECLHNRFLQRNSIPLESNSLTSKNN